MGRKRGCAAEMRNGMNQKERMLAGLPYKAWLDGLSEERMENKKRIYHYNSLSPEQGEEQAALIKEIIGKCGENIWIETPFHCDYGWNIEVGENFFANYNLTILDVGKVVIGKMRRLPRMYLFIRQVIRCIRIPETPVMSTVSASLSETMYGWAGIR